ncbi:MAG: glycosyltransferase family 2 protein [Bacteroidia bacterium]
MNLTIVIPSRNRAAKLSASLAALEKQSVTGFRVVVVDDGSDAEHREHYKKIVAASALSIQLIHQQNKGIAGATNTGIAAAEKGLIILMDDDILPAETHIEQHLKRHSEYPGAVICGTAETAPQPNSGKLNEYKIYMEESWSRNAFGNRTGLIRLSPECFTVSAANMSFESETYSKLGAFDETLRDCQDFEFGLRALQKNVPLYFDRHIRAIHNDEFSLTYFARRQRSYQLHSLKVLERYPEYIANFKIQSPPSSLLKRFVYALLRRKSVVRFIEHSALFQLLPKALRYRVYGSTLAALSFTRDAA